MTCPPSDFVWDFFLFSLPKKQGAHILVGGGEVEGGIWKTAGLSFLLVSVSNQVIYSLTHRDAHIGIISLKDRAILNIFMLHDVSKEQTICHNTVCLGVPNKYYIKWSYAFNFWYTVALLSFSLNPLFLCVSWSGICLF